MEFFKQLLSRDFTPHGFCYLWDPRIVWLHVISDGLITLSYYCIPIVLVYFIRKNRDLPFNRIFWMFGGFILACGTTHLMEIWNVWHSSYLVAGVIKAITAAVSVITVAMLIPLVPKAISLPGRMDLQGREITERAQAEVALRESLTASEVALKELADQKFALDQHAIVAITDVQGTITYVNDKFCAISQYSKEQLLGENHRILNSDHHPTEFFQEMYRTIANGKVWHGEIKNRAKDGSIYWVDTTIVPFLTPDGKPRQYVAIRADITERKRGEEALRESEERFQSMVNSIPQLAWMAEADGHIFWYNQRWYEYTGTTFEQMEGWAWQTVHDPAMLPKVLDRWKAAIAGGTPFEMEFPLRGADGRFGMFLTRVVPAKNLEGRVVRWFGTNTDITELRRAEEIRERLAAVVDSSDDAIISKNREGTITAWNHAAEKMFGYSSSEAVGNPIQMLIPPERANEEQDIQSRIGHGESVKRCETVRVRKDGTYIDVSATISPIRDHRGEIVGASQIARDITESKRAEETLKESLLTSERALKDLADQKFALDQHAIVAVTDVQGSITYVNDKFCSISQYSENELIGQNYRILNSGQHPKEFFQQMYHTIANGKVWHGEIKNRAKDGSIYWVDTTIVPFMGLEGKPRQYVAIRADITERKQVEEALNEQAQVLDSAQVFVRDMESRVVSWPRGAERLYGFKAEEALGIVSHDLFHTQFPEPVEAIERKLLETGAWDGELIHRKRDGSTIVVSSAWILHRDSQGRAARILETNTDITARKQAEAALQESLASTEVALKELADQKFALDQHAIVAVTDVQGTITYVNDKFCAISQYSEDELIGQNHRILNSGHHSKEFFQQMYHTIAKGKVWHGEIENRAKDGSIYWVNTTIVPTLSMEGKPRQYVAIRADITERKRAEEALKESLATSEAALRDLADQKFALDQHAIVAVTDVQGTITYVNEKFCAISQYAENELIGQNHRILNSGYHPKKFFQQMYQSIANGKVWHGEIKNRAKDGSIYWVDTTIVPFMSREGQPRQYVAIRADITERKLAGEALAGQALELSRSQQALETQTLMLRSVLDSMGEGLVAADEQGKFIIWNTAAEKIVGLGPANMPSQEWTEHYGLFLSDMVTPFPPEQNPLARAIRGESSAAEMFLRNTALTEGIWVEASANPLKDKDGVVHGGVAAFRDITRRKADEREILKLNDELELRVAERTAQLETANKELEAFSYSVSHDLRAPLRHISGFSQLLVEEFGSTLDPNAQQYLERIQAGAQKMGVLVDELLNLARVGRHALNLQPTQLNAMVAEVIAILQPDCQGRQVEWIIADLPAAACDPVLVKQIFQNLLANALKFTRPRARAVIEVSHREEEDGRPVFMVRDNGVGFSMKYVDKLFGVFQRLHRVEEFEGTGIGLVTVQRIVRKHGGQVWAEGELDKGAAFYFTLEVGKQTESKNNAATAGGRL